MLAATCPCGYENNGLALGGGMSSFMEHCAAPSLCPSCREVVTIDLMVSDATCPDCGGATTSYDNPNLRPANTVHIGSAIEWNLPDGRSFALDPDRGYTCPRCLEARMSFVVVGRFD